MIEHDATVRTLPPAPRIPSLDEEMRPSTGQIEPIADSLASKAAEPPGFPKRSRPATARKRRALPRKAKIALRLAAVALVLTLALVAGIASGSFLIAWISAQLQDAGAAHAVRIPIQTGTICSAAGALAVVIVGVRYGAKWFSEHKYPHFTCEACRGSGKDFEPRWLRLLRWGRRRAWRKCPSCGGNPTEDR